MHSHDQDVGFKKLYVLKSYNFDSLTFGLVGIHLYSLSTCAHAHFLFQEILLTSSLSYKIINKKYIHNL